MGVQMIGSIKLHSIIKHLYRLAYDTIHLWNRLLLPFPRKHLHWAYDTIHLWNCLSLPSSSNSPNYVSTILPQKIKSRGYPSTFGWVWGITTKIIKLCDQPLDSKSSMICYTII